MYRRERGEGGGHLERAANSTNELVDIIIHLKRINCMVRGNRSIFI